MADVLLSIHPLLCYILCFCLNDGIKNYVGKIILRANGLNHASNWVMWAL